MQKTLSQTILDYLEKYPKQFHWGGVLERNVSSRHKPSSIGRVLRDLAEHDFVYKDFKKVDGNRVVLYKFKK